MSHRVLAIKTMKKFPKEKEASEILQRVVNVVTPTLERRGWQIKNLTEFYPGNAGLLGLNVNRGHTVKLRLRTAENREVFLSFEEILGTLIHEITHIKISPHSAEFYKLMEDLYAEVEKDMAAGLTAVGTLNYVAFSGTAHRLGCSTGSGNVGAWESIRQSQTNVRAEAAKRRQKHGMLCRGSGQAIGAEKRHDGTKLSPRSMRAAAAQSRWMDQRQTRLYRSGQGEKRKLSAKDNQFQNESKSKYSSTQPMTELGTKSHNESESREIELISEVWNCGVCTFRNHSVPGNTTSRDQLAILDEKCKVCNNLRSRRKDAVEEVVCIDLKSPITVAQEPLYPRKRERQTITREMCVEWSCPHCTFVNITHKRACSDQSSCNRQLKSAKSQMCGQNKCSMCGI